jgi:hypothetical protein
VFSPRNSLAIARMAFPGRVSGHLLVITLTLGGTILDAEAVVAQHR